MPLFGIFSGRAETGGIAGALRLAILLFALFPAVGLAQPASEGMPIKRVEFRGLETISEAFVRRLVKTRDGTIYASRAVQEDVRELFRTRKFLNAFADTRVEDGQAIVVFNLQEKPTVLSVEIEGNKKFTSDELFKELTFAAGDVLDSYAVNKGREDILQKYQEAGYYYATVALDERLLEAERRVLYRVTEGPRVKVRKILFEGNRAFAEQQLRLKIRTKTYFWIFRTGAFDEEQADRDAADLQTFFRDEGYLDARVGYRLDFSQVDRSDLNLVFVIEAGPRYRIQEIVVSGNEVFATERVREKLRLAPGDVLRNETLKEDTRRVQDLYGEIGYVDTRVNTSYDFVEEPGVVVLKYALTENVRSRFGRITIRGNPNTKDEVVRRELRFYPGEDYNTVKARKAEDRIEQTGLFTKATITPLDDVGGFREALVEVEESQQVRFLIGFGVSTDNGVIGTLTVENRNFDLFGWPRTWGEFFRGRSFRGDGQTARIQLEPGTEVSRFRVDFSEPYLFDLPVSLGTSVYLFQRSRGAYDEQRLGGLLSLGRRFETGFLEGWAIEGAARVEGIDITDVDPLAPSDIRDAKGSSTLTSLKGALVRDTTDSRVFPTEGYRFTVAWEQVGALGGDFDFGKPSVSLAWYKTIREDIFDRRSVLAVRADAGWIAGDAPVFERYYAGGFGSIRGFSFRGISPRKGVLDDAVGGEFILLTGAEYSFPVYAKNIRGVTFLDMGTVEEGFEITAWRAAVGFGLRVTLDFFGPVPLVFDFGFPIAEQEDDENRVFNFSIGASF